MRVAGQIGLGLVDLRLMPEDSEGDRVRAERPPEALAQVPPNGTPVANPPETDGNAVAQADQEGDTQLGAVPGGGDFSGMTIAELLQLDLVLPQGAAGEAIDPSNGGETDVVDLTELSLLELMALRATTAQQQPDLPDLAPADVKLLLNDTGLDQGPPSHLSPDGGLTPIGVLPGTSSYSLPAPPSPPPPPTVNVVPDAKNDTYTVSEDFVLTKTKATGVLLNDTDANADTLTVSLVSGPPNGTLSLSANGAFSYDSNQNFNGTDSFTYRVSDGRGGFDTATVTITVVPVNDAPRAASMSSGGSVDENSASATVVGVVSATDPDVGSTLTYSLVDDAGGRFTINATTGEIMVANGSLLNYEANSSHTVTVRVSDGSLASQTVLTIDVNDVNEAPGAASFADGSSVNENSANGAVVGTVDASDPDLGDIVTYSLSDDAGGRFAIDANTGVITVADGSLLNFETSSSHSITVVASDGALTSSTTLTVTVNNVNEAPTDVVLSSATVDENDVGAVIGNLTVTDPDAGDTHSFSVSDPRFEVVGGQLKLAAGNSLDFEAASTVSIDVTATDKGGLDRTEVFVVSINDVNEAPTDVTLSSATVAENADGAVIGILAAIDPDAGDSHSFSVSDGRFEVVGNQLQLKAGNSLDFETEPTVNLDVIATDAGGLDHSKAFVITITDVNEAPTDITLSSAAVAENDVGAVIGKLTAIDPDADDSHSFSVSDGRFEVVGDQLQLKAGNSLDFEIEPSVSVDVTATDKGGLDHTKSFVITVIDVAGENLTGDGGPNLLTGGAEDDTLSGLAGNDTLVGGGGPDVLSGGADDDTLTWDPADVTVDGGTGTDTLLVIGGNLDLSAASALSALEKVDLGTSNGNNTLTLTATDVINLSDTATLTVTGDAADSIDAGTGWIGGLPDGSGNIVYTQLVGPSLATLVVDASVNTNPGILNP